MGTDWTEDEVVVVCAAVKANGWNSIRSDSLTARRLSVLLIEASYVPMNARRDTFRSPSSIHRKSWDIITVLPSYAGTPTKGGRITKEVVQRFLDAPDEMDQLARDIRVQFVSSRVATPAASDLVEFGLEEASEGAEAEVVLLRRERSPALRRRKISAALAAGQLIECELCGFNFGKVYGEHGNGYIEVHHVLPLHASGTTITRLEDLVLLCANCHRMIHRSPHWLEPEQLRRMLVTQNQCFD